MHTRNYRPADGPSKRQMPRRSFGPVVLALLLALATVAGCGGDEPPATNIALALSVTPAQPAVGPATIEVSAQTENGEPVTGADLEVEGTMTHAGMEPVTADLTEESDGRYVTRDFQFTMGGDWVIIVRGTLADGTKVEQSFDVPGVSGPRGSIPLWSGATA